MSATLQDVIEANQEEAKRVYGVFDQSRVPELEIRTFKGVKNLRLAVSPDCSYRLVHAALAAARRTIDLYIYNISADHLLELLSQAKGRGVKVRLMYDVMDARGDERNKIAALDVEAKEAPSSGQRQVFTVCHQKFAVIDGAVVLLGSANWATTSIPKTRLEGPARFKKGNREWLVTIAEPEVAAFFGTVFQEDWDIEEMEAPSGAAQPPPEVVEVEPEMARAAALRVPEEVFDVGMPELGAGVAVTPLLSPDNYYKVVLGILQGAQQSIDIEQQYIVAGGPRTQRILEALAGRLQAGVAVRLIVSPAYPESWDKTVKTLEAAGLDGCLRAIDLDSFTHLHNKGVLVDRRLTVVTSTNMSENSITKAREAGVLIDSPVVGEWFGRVFDVDWDSGIDPADVKARLASSARDLERVEEAPVEVHPADVRVL